MSKRISGNKKPNGLNCLSSKLKRIKKLLKSEKILARIFSLGLAVLSLLQVGEYYVQGSSNYVKKIKTSSKTQVKKDENEKPKWFVKWFVRFIKSALLAELFYLSLSFAIVTFATLYCRTDNEENQEHFELTEPEPETELVMPIGENPYQNIQKGFSAIDWDY